MENNDYNFLIEFQGKELRTGIVQAQNVDEAKAKIMELLEVSTC